MSLTPTPTPPKKILTISLSKHLTGVPVDEVIAKDWKKVDACTAEKFHNEGFNVDPIDFPASMDALSKTLHEQEWDGALVGWCLRGYPERTEMFEQAVSVCVEKVKVDPNMKILFCTGPGNLAESVLRNFG